MSGTNRVLSSENVLKGNSALTKALDNSNDDAIKVEDKKEGKKQNKAKK